LTDTQTDSEWNENDPAPFMQKSNESGNETEVRFNADYYRPIGAEGKLEAGYQLRYESGNEDYRYNEFDHILNDWVNFEERNNDFGLMRNIQAAYAIFGTSTRIVDFQVGLRAEYTDRILSQRALDEKFEIHRIDFFRQHILQKSCLWISSFSSVTAGALTGQGRGSLILFRVIRIRLISGWKSWTGT